MYFGNHTSAYFVREDSKGENSQLKTVNMLKLHSFLKIRHFNTLNSEASYFYIVCPFATAQKKFIVLVLLSNVYMYLSLV